MTESAYAEISFKEPTGQSKVTVGRTLLDAVQAARLEISNICAGRGVCGKCRVVVMSGSENLSPVTSLERMSLTERDMNRDSELHVAPESLWVGRSTFGSLPRLLPDPLQLLVAGIQPKVKLNPAVTKHLLRLTTASLTDSRTDLRDWLMLLYRNASLND